MSYMLSVCTAVPMQAIVFLENMNVVVVFEPRNRSYSCLLGATVMQIWNSYIEKPRVNLVNATFSYDHE